VVVKRRAGRGHPTPNLVILTEGAFRALTHDLIRLQEEKVCQI